ncbi:MAG: hypothetical protein ACJ8FY_11530 [Gemmataceae bacterium]
MEENLSGYLLNALDPATCDQVERYLLDHPDAQNRLDSIRRTLDLLAEDREEMTPSANLKYATLAQIAEYRCRTLPKAPLPSASQVGSRRSWWRRSDVAMAALLLITIGSIGVPTLANWWRQERIIACKDNLRRWHAALVGFSDTHHGDFPRVEKNPPLDFAGAFVPILEDSESLPRDISVGCPGNGEHRPVFKSVSEIAALQSSQERTDEYLDLRRKMGGCYAYSLGYQETVNGTPQHFGLRSDSGDDLPIMSDKPPFSQGTCPAGNSPNHGGSGQNVLFIGGNVRFYRTRSVGLGGDDIFSNNQGIMAVGFGISDSVLGPSEARPYPTLENP